MKLGKWLSSQDERGEMMSRGEDSGDGVKCAR